MIPGVGADPYRLDGETTTDVGLATSLSLVNDLVIEPSDDAEAAVRQILSVDPPSVDALRTSDIGAFVLLAQRLHQVAVDVADGHLDRAAEAVNVLLAEHSAHPHLAKEDGRWQLHHHPPDAELIPMWTAIAADAFARLIGSDLVHRVGQCSADDCARLYFDRSKNGVRRFCSTRCQNRVKAAAFRARKRSNR